MTGEKLRTALFLQKEIDNCKKCIENLNQLKASVTVTCNGLPVTDYLGRDRLGQDWRAGIQMIVRALVVVRLNELEAELDNL